MTSQLVVCTLIEQYQRCDTVLFCLSEKRTVCWRSIPLH